MKIEPLSNFVIFPEREILVFKNSDIVRPKSANLCLCKNQQLLQRVLTELVTYKENTYIVSCMNGIQLKRTIGTIDFCNKLDVLLIDNISAFYWDVKTVDKYNYSKLGFESYESSQESFITLTKLLQQIRHKYHCSVVVTAFDIEFDVGINPAKESTLIDFDCQKYSKLPLALLESFDSIMHINKDNRIELFQKTTNKWSNYDLG